VSPMVMAMYRRLGFFSGIPYIHYVIFGGIVQTGPVCCGLCPPMDSKCMQLGPHHQGMLVKRSPNGHTAHQMTSFYFLQPLAVVAKNENSFQKKNG
jgi:hypothetical protein